MVTLGGGWRLIRRVELFPINRCHQRVVTGLRGDCFDLRGDCTDLRGFQSIGVTSEW